MNLLEILFAEKILKKLKKIIRQNDTIMATQAEQVTKLNAVAAQLQKISVESTTTLEKVAALQAIIDAMPNASAELVAAVDAVAAQVQAVDDLTPDVVTPPPSIP